MRRAPLTNAMVLTIVTTTVALPAPTVFLHGLNGAASDFNHIIAWMHEAFGNGTVMHSLPLFEGSDSIKTPLPVQRDAIIRYLVQNADPLQLTGGFNFVAHSQGALLARSIVQVGAR